MSETAKPLPIQDSLSRPWFEAAAEGKLLIQRCAACGKFQFYPRVHCVHCFAADPEWHEASGRGTLHTYSVIYQTPNPEFAGDCPYVLAIIDLEEGVRMTSRLIDVPEEAIACDMPVRVTFGETDGVALPLFTAAEAS
jgi:uncharacterized OB-fold protein